MVVIYDILQALYASSALHIYEILLLMGLQIQENCMQRLPEAETAFFHQVEIKNAYL